MCLVHRDLTPIASHVFEALVRLEHHPNECKTNFQPVLHIGNELKFFDSLNVAVLLEKRIQSFGVLFHHPYV